MRMTACIKIPTGSVHTFYQKKTTRGGNSLDKKIMLVSVTEQEIFVGKTLVLVKELFWAFLLQNASLVVLQIWLLSKLTCTGKHKAKIHKDT